MQQVAGLGDMASHLASLERQTGRTVREVADFPFPLEHVWRWFLELTGRRGTGGFSANPLTYPELESWARLTGRTPTPLEVRLLMRVDDVLVAALRPTKS